MGRHNRITDYRLSSSLRPENIVRNVTECRKNSGEVITQTAILCLPLPLPLPEPHGKGKGKSIAVHETSPTPLQEITYHMGSHSVTCHPAEVTFPPLPQPKLVLDLATPKRRKAELT